MKLVKLSLVAAMAAGLFATTTSAAPLDEVIKDVDVSGYTRLRYTHDDQDADNEADVKDKDGSWNFKGILDIKTKIDDNFFAVVGLRYNETDKGESRSTATGADTDQSDIDIYRAYFGYKIAGTTFTVGRQALGTFFTDDMYGDGIKVTNTDIEGLTLAALWMDSLESDGDIGSLDLGRVDGKLTTDHNLYGVAAMGNYDPVSFQIWYAALEDVTDLFAVELATSFDITENFNLGLKGQYAFADMDSDFMAGTNNEAADSDFWAVEASTDVYGFNLTAGYIDFSADDDNKVSLTSFEDQGDFISPGEELLDYTLYSGENNLWFVTAGYTIPNSGVTIGGDYLDGERTVNGIDYDMSEAVARITYKHNKKLTFKTWYSWVEDDINGEGWSNDRIRFEAKYSF